MQYRRLGFSGINVSAFALGAWRSFGEFIDDNTTERIMAEAFDSGINFFDAAESYGKGAAELAMGKALKNLKWPRENYIITSKISPREVPEHFGVPLMKGLNRKRLTECVDAALSRLKLDYIDIFYCHRPYPDTALEDIVITMDALIKQGKIFYWGTSEFSAAQLLRLWEIAREYGMSPPLVEQCGHNMLGRWRMERDLVPVFENIDMGTTTFCPLRCGVLTGKYLGGIPKKSRAAVQGDGFIVKEELEKVCRIKKVADRLGIPLVHLALAWILKNPNVSTVILGSSKPGQISENVRAAECAELLSEDIMREIDSLLDNHPLKQAG